jgi:putative transposase
MLKAAEELAQVTGMAEACRLLNIPRSTLYRVRQPAQEQSGRERPESSRQPTKSVRALSSAEREAVRDVLNSERFQDQSPRQVYATLLDEDEYLCHWRTMYRVLEEHEEVRERRNQLRHPAYTRPELLATGPNQLWSWDITRMRGPVTWSYYYLYVMLDVFSRYVVAWLLAEQESATLAQELVAAAYAKQQIEPGQLTIHADRGAPMTAKSMTMLMSDLGINESHSRPHVSDDNPYSEAQFHTVKYRPDYPDRFGCLGHARRWCEGFFPWYNNEHHHSALHLLTPADVHYDRAAEKLAQRHAVLQHAYVAHPERFVNGPPTMPLLPAAVWINRPVVTDDPETSSASLPIVSVVY